MNNTDDFKTFINILNKTQCLDDIVVIGSWAEYLYEKCNLLDDFVTVGKTQDMDFLVYTKRNVEMKKGLISEALNEGFLYKEDYINSYSKFSKGEFEVEFLIPQNGDGINQNIKTSIGVNAEPLTHVEILAKNTVAVKVDNIMIRVPEPEAYCLQKMMVNKDRKNKQERDQAKIDNIYPHLKSERLNELYLTCSKKEQTSILSYVKEHYGCEWDEFCNKVNNRNKEQIDKSDEEIER